MSYSVYAYLTDADKVKSVYGACDNLLINQLKIALKQELDSLNDYFSDSLNTDKDAYAALADIVNGEIRYPEIAFMYGYVYEKICNHYGTQIYCAENLWQLDSQSTFIPIPLSDDFPYIISIPVSDLESKRTEYTSLQEGNGIGDYDHEQEMDDLNFIFDEAVEAFIGSDLWLHHKISRLIALSILALAYLMSFEYYLFCDEYRFVVHQGSSGKIFLADIGKFHEYWFYQGLLVAYLLLTIGVSHLLRRKKLLTNRDNA